MIESDNYQQKEVVNPKNIISKIFFSPKEAFTFIVNYKYEKYVTLLLILSGIVKAFDKAISKNMGDHLPLWGVISCSILIGITFGWIVNFIYAAAISWTGKWLNGKGNTKSILNVLSYALLPSIFSLFLIILQILIYGNTIFQSSYEYLFFNLSDNLIHWTFYFFDLVLIIWSVILLVIGLSVVQKISIVKAILNLILPAFLIVLMAFSAFVIYDLFK